MRRLIKFRDAVPKISKSTVTQFNTWVKENSYPAFIGYTIEGSMPNLIAPESLSLCLGEIFKGQQYPLLQRFVAETGFETPHYLEYVSPVQKDPSFFLEKFGLRSPITSKKPPKRPEGFLTRLATLNF